MSEFAGETAVVTGAASNIGAAIARRLANAGVQTILIDINADGLGATAASFNAQAPTPVLIKADLATSDGWHAVADQCADMPVDMFVHAACPRRNEADTVAAVSEETFDAMINVNVRSGFFLARTFGLSMQHRGAAGRILFITSLHATSPRNLPHYAASKAAQTMLVAELARYFAASNIRVNAIAPGVIPGGGFTPDGGFDTLVAKIPAHRTGSADEVANTALAVLSNRLMPYVTGTTLPVDGGVQHYNWIDAAQAD